ncbi:putative N-acetylmannosaminyltransferase [Caloramator mitchellensis]|uniref:Putative N-acetylmannosaminyltransferase n=1 Tax=Caloramator mitchellensis TaxID=908809 RepID=A0A0R3K1V4_CALMK|nr:WecB/TagA/CpsF family glycosyltransferase [Caloramator mitchellensis]KRQ87380.1 putative N-acetylmannosaminyltransferase [Caloramator mitchellensis]
MLVEMFGMNIYANSLHDLINELDVLNYRVILSANPEIVQCINKNKIKFDDDVMFIPDGIGTVYAVRLVKGISIKKIAGIDFLYEILNISKDRDYKIYFLGARPYVVERAAKRAVEEFGAKITGFHHGYFNDDELDKIIADINNSGADFLFVGLGCPKQEKFILQNKDRIKAKYLVTVGGSFDVLSGSAKRAPKWMIDLGLEWLYRTFRQPVRIFRLRRIATFLIRTILNL